MKRNNVSPLVIFEISHAIALQLQNQMILGAFHDLRQSNLFQQNLALSRVHKDFPNQLGVMGG